MAAAEAATEQLRTADALLRADNVRLGRLVVDLGTGAASGSLHHHGTPSSDPVHAPVPGPGCSTAQRALSQSEVRLVQPPVLLPGGSKAEAATGGSSSGSAWSGADDRSQAQGASSAPASPSSGQPLCVSSLEAGYRGLQTLCTSLAQALEAQNVKLTNTEALHLEDCRRLMAVQEEVRVSQPSLAAPDRSLVYKLVVEHTVVAMLRWSEVEMVQRRVCPLPHPTPHTLPSQFLFWLLPAPCPCVRFCFCGQQCSTKEVSLGSLLSR